MRRAALALVSGSLIVLGGAGPATAGHVSPVELQVDIGGSYGGTYDEDALLCSSGGGYIVVCSGSSMTVGDLTLDSWNMTFDTDPVVSGTVVVTNNNLLAAQQFTLLFTLPTGAIGPSTLSGGSIQGGVTDNTGDGATLYTNSGSAFYQGLIDGASDPARTLYPDYSSVVAGAYLSNNLPNAAFGTPIPSLASPAVAANIGIRLDFWLTPGDSASFTSNFVVVPIPEPGTAALFGLGLVALGLRRRR